MIEPPSPMIRARLPHYHIGDVPVYPVLRVADIGHVLCPLAGEGRRAAKHRLGNRNAPSGKAWGDVERDTVRVDVDRMLTVVATDVGAWRALGPVLQELRRRDVEARVMLAEPAASYARRDGVEHVGLAAPTLEERAAAVLSAGPSMLLLGTSTSDVVERTLAREARRLGRPRAPVPTVGVLDAMLFVERRFGPALGDLPNLVACPDVETAERLRRAGAAAGRVAVTGQPALGAIAAVEPRDQDGRGPIDVLFVSQPIPSAGRADSPFLLDEKRSLGDVLDVLAGLERPVPDSFRVRVRWHPTQRAAPLPAPPPNVRLEPDAEPDRLRGAARARLVIGVSSTLLAEARMLPRHAIAYLPGPYWDHEPVYAPSQGVRRARSAEQLRELVEEGISTPPAPAPIEAHASAARRVADLALASMRAAPDHRQRPPA